MFHPVDTTTWLSVLSRKKLQSAASPDRPRGDADKLLRKVLLRNSITRVDLALAEAQTTSSPLLPTTSPSPPLQVSADPEPPASSTSRATDEDEFVFPDATSLTASRVYSAEDEDAEARWLDSVLEDLSDDEEEEEYGPKGIAAHGASSDDEDEDDDYFDLEWLMSTTNEEPVVPIISVPAPPPPSESLNLEHLLPPFKYPLPDDDDDDDLSTAPDMEADVEGDSEADSVEWPLTPGQRSITSMLGRSSTSASAPNQLVASAVVGREDALPSITEEAVFEHNVRPAIHVDEPRLYRYSPAAPNEQPLTESTTTPAVGPSC